MFLSKFMLKSKQSVAMLNTTSIRSVAFAKVESRKPKEENKSEEVYFSEHERNVLKSLINKMEEQLHQKNQEESNDHQAKTHSNGRGHGHKHGHGHKEEHLHEDHKKNHETLAQIFEKHGVKQDSNLFQELNEWRKQK